MVFSMFVNFGWFTILVVIISFTGIINSMVSVLNVLLFVMVVE